MNQPNSASDNKQLVAQWFMAGPSSEAGLAMVTADFKWIAPRSEAELFGSSDAILHGPEGLRTLPAIDQAVYANAEDAASSTNMHFMIAEDDLVVIEFDAAFTTHTGEPYHNYYCMVIVCSDGKIAEVREHADTHYFHEVVLGTPEKRSAVLARVDRLRAALNAS